ncbi:MAG: 4Fe-4S dicluster domain-containing protein [Desulfoplanes sp.]|nr:4Fe-4S dicluster domain-containing protein [Desulfoplanes sp.]MDD4648971.1 4Fe-4S dicluster domain-containing protein [Desulfoplanes sp.]
MYFSILLWISIALLIAGLFYKISRWFCVPSAHASPTFSSRQKITAVVRGLLQTFCSAKILLLGKALLLDILLQRPLFKAGKLRWFMHELIFLGFVLLTLMHAMAPVVTEKIFPAYTSTLNPYLLLRDLLGIMVLSGVGIAVYRRFIIKEHLLASNKQDILALVLLGTIIVSGIILEGMKMASYTEFMHMVTEYSALDPKEDSQELTALTAYWVKDFALVSPVIPTISAKRLALGKTSHEEYCASCHVSNKWGFAGYATAKIIAPAATFLDRAGTVHVLWYVHILACFLGLATLPFTKFFHIITTPLSLLANAVMDEKSQPETVAVRQAMEPAACTHCSVCSQVCSAMMSARVLNNPLILPGEKMQLLKAVAENKAISPEEKRALMDGVFICTSCNRCFAVCPSGINLKELWMTVRKRLLDTETDLPVLLSPLSYAPALQQDPEWTRQSQASVSRTFARVQGNFAQLMRPDVPLLLQEQENKDAAQLSRNKTFSYCFVCQNCTTICPVVARYEHPEKELGMLPHQIMCSLGLGLTEMCSKSKMIWECSTCYQCQEHCPQNVRIVDLFYRLKHAAYENTTTPGEKPKINMT